MKLDFRAIFDEHDKANQKTWAHDRDKTVGASEVFGCIRQAWFKKRGKEFGYKPDPEFKNGWGATSRGDLIENYHAVPAIKGQLPAGTKLLGAGKRQQTLIVGNNSATPDGLVTGLDRDTLSLYGVEDIESDCILLEFKSIDPRINLRKPKEVHFGQVQQQLGIIRKLSPLKPMYAVILYFNASFLDDMKVFPIRFDAGVWKNAQGRADAVFSEDDPAKMMAEGKLENGCEYCPFKRACDSVMKGSHPFDKPLADDAETIEELRRLAATQEEASERKKQAEKDLALANEQVKEYLREKKIKGVRQDDLQVTFSFSEGRVTLDKAAMKADGIDVSQYEKKGQPFETLKVNTLTRGVN